MRNIFAGLRGLGPRKRPNAFLGRLAHDRRGNTLAIMAAALIPFCGLVGGGIDVSRMYITKTRLQHACDAGALAGRKQMGTGVWTANNNAANTAAEQFFDANYAPGSYGSQQLVKAFTESGGKVTGTASATLPMTLMRVLGKTQETLSVSCEVDMGMPSSDIMFVLDVTGSMEDKAAIGDAQNKIAGLKTAVKCFYEKIAGVDTNATCPGGVPSAGASTNIHMRFGFVPYAMTVNVGRLLPTAYMADAWNYQTREPVNDPVTTNTYPNPPVDTTGPAGTVTAQASNWTDTGSNSCSPPASTTVGPTVTTTSTTPVTQSPGNTIVYETRTTTGMVTTEYRRVTVFFIFCEIQSRTVTNGSYTTVIHTQYPVQVTTNVFSKWRYGALRVDISPLKNGTGWNDSFQLPIGPNGTARTITWDGCIEERQTKPTTDYDPIPTDAYDLDIDSPPTPGNPATQWKPALKELIYPRRSTSSDRTNMNSWNRDPFETTSNYINDIEYYCPPPAKKLQVWNATDFQIYVDGLVTNGSTYHDIGLLWGARLISPTGIFAAENAATGSTTAIERHIIFMTDGDTHARPYDYNAYGVPWFDRRQTGGSAPTREQLEEQVDLRAAALCSAIKNRNITLWVISFGKDVSTDTQDRLKDCATTSHFFNANTSDDLTATFTSIATQVSQLRLTR